MFSVTSFVGCCMFPHTCEFAVSIQVHIIYVVTDHMELCINKLKKRLVDCDTLNMDAAAKKL